MAKKKGAAKNKSSFEESLWETATKLRGSVESSEYKHVVLSLIFLKFVSDTASQMIFMNDPGLYRDMLLQYQSTEFEDEDVENLELEGTV